MVPDSYVQTLGVLMIIYWTVDSEIEWFFNSEGQLIASWDQNDAQIRLEYTMKLFRKINPSVVFEPMDAEQKAMWLTPELFAKHGY